MAQQRALVHAVWVTINTASRSRWDPRSWPLDPRVLLGGLPLIAFIAGHQIGTAVAILAALAASLFVYLIGSRRGALGLLALFFFATTLTWAIVGLIVGDESAYLRHEAMRDFVASAMAVGTVLIGRPLFALVIRELVPSLERRLPMEHPVFMWTTLFWAAVNAAQGVVRLVMLNGDLGVGQYLLWSRLFAWPTTLLMYAIIVLVVWRVTLAERERESRRAESMPSFEAETAG
jgi:hypothetical protein